MSTNKDISALSKKHSKETLTPHRLTVAILINDFFAFREAGRIKVHKTRLIYFKCILDTGQGLSKKHVRDFCILLLKLIQSPDLTFEELQNVLMSGKYLVHQQLITNFNDTLAHLNSEGTGYLLNLVDSIGKLILRDSDAVANKWLAQVNKKSVVGYYLRRLLINFDKLTFSEVTAVLSAFQRYYAAENPHEKMDSKWKLEIFCADDWYSNTDQWSRRQAELFIASQAALLNGNEEKAYNPKDLNMHVKNLLKTNPDLTEAHFLNYLNYLRVKEFCGAVRSLYHCFDRNGLVDSKGNVDEKCRGFRFAALNLAVLHFHFGHREEALAALKEAIMLAQETNDNLCLQHALSWLYCLTHTNKDKLLEHSILKSLDLNLTYIVSLGIQSFVQYAGISGGTPKYIFETITRSDIVNCQHAYGDLTCSSYAQKAGMWLFYGKTEMSSLWSQLLLRLNSDISSPGKIYFSESLCQAMCNITNHLILQGKYTKAYAILILVKERFPNEPVAHIWMLSECLFTFIRALHHEDWIEAEAAAQRMAVYDVWESHLRMAELLLQKRDFSGAHKCISEILDSRDNSNVKLRIDYHVRAMILLAEAQYCSSFPNVIPPAALNVCLAYANDFHIDYLGALVYLHLANVQLLMNMPAQALKLLDRSLVHILTHGGNYDRAKAMLLYVKCIVANAGHKSNEEREKIILEATEMLNTVSADFTKVEAYSRVKDVLYLQARLYNEVNLTEKRNKCALEYRLLEEEHPSKNSTALVTFL